MPPETISQRITLDGSEKIKQQLDEIGSAGDRSFADMGRSLRVNFSKAIGEFEHNIGELRTSIGEMADRIIPHFREVASIGFAGAAVEIGRMTLEANRATRSLENMANAAGISVGFLEKMQLVGISSGVDQDKLSAGLSRVSAAMGKAREEIIKTEGAQQGLKKATDGLVTSFEGGGTILRGGHNFIQDFSDPFKTLNIDMRLFPDTAKGNEAAIIAIGHAFDISTSATIRATAARALFGREWRDELPAYLAMGDALRSATAIIEKYNLGTSEEETKASRVFLAAYDSMGFVLKRIKDEALITFGSAFVPLFDGVKKLLGENNNRIQAFAMNLKASIEPAVKDIVGLMNGGSVADVQTGWLKDFLSLAIAVGKGFKATFDIIIGGFKLLEAVLTPVASTINEVLGTSLSPPAVAIGAAVVYMAGGFTVLKDALILAVLPFRKIIEAWKWFLGSEAIAARAAAALAPGVEATTAAVAGVAVTAGVAAATVGAVVTAKRAAKQLDNGELPFNGIDPNIDPFNFAHRNTPGTPEPLATADIPPVGAKPPAPAPAAAADPVAKATEKVTVKAKYTFDQLVEFDKQLAVAKMSVDTGVAKMGVQTASQYNVSIDKLKAAGQQTASVLEKGVAGQVQILKGGVRDENASLAKAVDQQVTVLRGAAAAAAISMENDVAVLRGGKPNYKAVQPYSAPQMGGLSGIGGGAQGVGYAAGGDVRGPGGRDRVPIWATAGEYVMQVAAVQRYGRGVMHAMNSMSFPTTARGFADGGFVPAQVVGAPTHLNGDISQVNFKIGDHVYVGFNGPTHLISEMIDHSNRLQVRSAGKKPSWFGA